ncbi:DUF1223 domain-containing protein [Oricola indica]|uniref:DUF1223 domain-containing protein n=1 Tax=Oricola indica TaxID=2872591 RepID=UPI001CC01E90
MKRTFAITAIAASLLALSPAAAPQADESVQKPLGVVELFTSQGCNSCPPADLALAKFAARDDVVALGYHVDYWDYLGWQDTLGSDANTRRQYEYAEGLNRRGVYTPQAVINGRSHTNGGHYREISEMMARDKDRGLGLTVGLKFEDMGDRMRVSAEGAPTGGDKIHLVLVYFVRQADVAIDRGENAGKTISYVNAVTDYQTIGMWEGEAMTVDIPRSELAAKNADGCAVLLQKTTKGGRPGAIIGAAILPRQSS